MGYADPTSAADVVRLWLEIIEARDRIKADAVLQGGRGAPSGHAQRRLVELDESLDKVRKCFRGLDELESLHEDALKIAHQRRKDEHDLAALVVRQTRVGSAPWYSGGEARERQISELLRPWPEIKRARDVLEEGLRRGKRGAAQRSLSFDERVFKVWSDSRVRTQARRIVDRHATAFETSAEIDLLKNLYEEILESFDSTKLTDLGWQPAVMTNGLAARARKLAHRREKLTPRQFRVAQEREVFRAHLDDIASVAEALRVDTLTIAGVFSEHLDGGLGADEAALAVLRRIGAGSGRTIRRRMVRSRATTTTEDGCVP